jgi:hypothetical protein
VAQAIKARRPDYCRDFHPPGRQIGTHAPGRPYSRAMRAYEVRRAQRGHNQTDPGDLGLIIVCAIDGGSFVPLIPSWEYDSEAHAQLEADRLCALEADREGGTPA